MSHWSSASRQSRPRPAPQNPFSLFSLCGAAAVALSTLALPAAQAQTGTRASGLDGARSYSLAPGPLGTVLSRFAGAAGVALSFSADLTAGRQSPGLQGSFTVQNAFERLLAGSGLEASRQADGSFLLRAQPGTGRAAGAAAAVAPAAPRIASPPAGANVPADPVLPAVVVTATQDRRERAFETPGSVSVITREDMDRTATRHASDILQATPGVTTVTNEQVPSVSVNVRGLKDFGRVNMNIDGMRQNYQRTGHQQRNGEMFFDPELLSSVEIEKGPGSGLGSLGATGGIATFQTLQAADIIQPGRDIGLRIRGSTGVGGLANGSELSGSAAFAVRFKEDFDLLAAHSRRNSGEFQPGQKGEAFDYANGQYTVPANVVNGTGQDMNSTLVKLGWNASGRTRVQATLLRTAASFGESAVQNYEQAYLAQAYCNPQFPNPDPLCATLPPYDPANAYRITSNSRITSESAALDFSHKGDNRLVDLAAKLYRVSTRASTDSVDATTPVRVRTRTDTTGGYLTNRAAFEFGRGFSVALDTGVEAFLDHALPGAESTTLSGNQIRLASGNTPEGRRLMASAFARAGIFHGDWLQVTPGVRYDYYRLWGLTGFDNNFNRNYNKIDVDHRARKVLPTLGIGVTPVPQVQFFANAGEGWRPPAITEALISGSAAGHAVATGSFPNFLLKPEESRSWDLGVNLRFDELLAPRDKLRVKLAHFDTRISNYIYLGSQIGLPGQQGASLFQSMFVNAIDPINLTGQEIDARYEVADWDFGVKLTHLERRGELAYRAFPLGGAAGGPLADNYVFRGYEATLYAPAPAKYFGSIEATRHFMNRRASLGVQVRGATKSGGAMSGTTYQFQDGQKSYAILDLHGSWQVQPSLRLGFNLRNLFDLQYAQTMGDAWVRTYAPGRTLTASLEWKF